MKKLVIGFAAAVAVARIWLVCGSEAWAAPAVSIFKVEAGCMEDGQVIINPLVQNNTSEDQVFDIRIFFKEVTEGDSHVRRDEDFEVAYFKQVVLPNRRLGVPWPFNPEQPDNKVSDNAVKLIGSAQLIGPEVGEIVESAPFELCGQVTPTATPTLVPPVTAVPLTQTPTTTETPTPSVTGSPTASATKVAQVSSTARTPTPASEEAMPGLPATGQGQTKEFDSSGYDRVIELLVVGFLFAMVAIMVNKVRR